MWVILVYMLLPGQEGSTHLSLTCPTIQCATDVEAQAWDIKYTYEVKLYAPGTYARFPWPDSYHQSFRDERDS